MFSYIHDGKCHTKTTKSYMDNLGLDDEAQESVLAMKEYEQSKDTAERKLFKHNRKKMIDTLTVEVDGMVFDGDEASQSRMGRASFSMQSGEVISWVLADNTKAEVTKEQLSIALRLAGAKQAEFWSD